MKKMIPLAILALLLVLVSSTTHAATPEQICQSRKNMELARFVTCRAKVLSGLPESRFRVSVRDCRRKFTSRWRRIIKKTKNSQASCSDAPLKAKDFRAAIATHLKDVTSLVGRNQKGNAHKRRCRAVKTVAAGRYAACKYRAESRLARTANTSAYESHIARCEEHLEETWQKISRRTEVRGTSCFDAEQTVEEYKTTLDRHMRKVTNVLSGTDEFDPVRLSVAGSPLALIADGTAQSITITNNSTKATASDIVSDFTGTALAGNVSETGNTCSSVAPGASCTLTFTPGNTLVTLTEFPIKGSNTGSAAASIEIVAPATATLSVAGSPLSLTVNGPTGNIQITNTSAYTTALDIESDLSGTALAGNVTETGNTCSSVAAGGSCTLTFTPGNTVTTATAFTVLGSNTVTVTPTISVQSGSALTGLSPTSGSASGGTGITLTGTGLTGATSVTFDGIAATSVNVVNSTTVTAVTPAHAAGAVDVVIDTPAGGATLVAGYTYAATAVGQSSGGGIIACLNGGLNNLIAATADNSTAVEWGGFGTQVSALSNTDGASNTATATTALGNNGGVPYATQVCSDYEVDSQGNTPCEAGNTCYSDWFLPAGENTTVSGQLNCLYINRVAIGGFASALYWSSKESGGESDFDALGHNFSTGAQTVPSKSNTLRVRCVRAFTP